MAGFLIAKCDPCDALVMGEIDNDGQDHVVCKGCGAPLPVLSESGNVLRGSAWRGGMSKSKGLLFKQHIEFGYQRDCGGVPFRHERLIDHQNNRYRETVTARETGEVIHHCDEPLTNHTGHGSDRNPR